MFRVKLITDSRGAWLMRALSIYNDPEIFFSVKFRKGAGLIKLWEFVEHELLNGDWDIIFVLGSVCDLTDRYGNRASRSFWPPHDMKERFAYVKSLLEGMANNYRLLNPKTLLCFLPECGMDLVRYNRVFHPVPIQVLIMQEEFENNLRDLQKFTQGINRNLGCVTPWTLEVTNVNRGGRMVPVYDRSYDGLHYSYGQIQKLAFVLWKYVQIEVLGKKLSRPRPA